MPSKEFLSYIKVCINGATPKKILARKLVFLTFWVVCHSEKIFAELCLYSLPIS